MLIKNGKIHDGLGNIFVKDILIEKGIIKDISEELEGEGIDAEGLEIFPGFIDPVSHWGINGSSTEIRNSSDDNDEKSDPVTPELEVIYAFNGRAITLQQLPAYGITSVGVMPSNNNVFGGQMGAFTTEGINPFKMVLKEGIGMKASVTKEIKDAYGKRGVMPMTKMKIFNLLEENLRKASEYNPDDEKTVKDYKLEALKRVIDKEMPLFIACDDTNDIQKVLNITKKYNLQIVFCNGFGITGKDDYLVDENISLVCCFSESDAEPRSKGMDYKGIGELAEKGLLVALGASTGIFVGREDLLWHGMDMVKAIKNPETVLKMMTYNSARVLGISDITGSIEKGKRADLVLWSKNPLETFQAEVMYTFIGGEMVYRKGDPKKCYI